MCRPFYGYDAPLSPSSFYESTLLHPGLTMDGKYASKEELNHGSVLSAFSHLRNYQSTLVVHRFICVLGGC